MIKKIILLLAIANVSYGEPNAKRQRINFNLDAEYISKVMTDLIVQREWRDASCDELEEVMLLIPYKYWAVLDYEEVVYISNDPEKMGWFRKNLMKKLDETFYPVELEELCNNLKDTNVNHYLFDAI